MPLHWRAWKQVTESHRLHFPEDRFYSLGGVPSRDILKMLSEEQGRQIDYEAVAKEKEADLLALMPQVRPIELISQNCARQLRQAAHGRGLGRHPAASSPKCSIIWAWRLSSRLS